MGESGRPTSPRAAAPMSTNDTARSWLPVSSLWPSPALLSFHGNRDGMLTRADQLFARLLAAAWVCAPERRGDSRATVGRRVAGEYTD